MMQKLRQKTLWDGKAHAVAAKHPWRANGIAIATGYQKRAAIAETLERAIQSTQKRNPVAEWIGFGIDLAAPYNPLVIREQY
jgi:hypothetical protein